ncbi:MAG TPA: non-canonical purine NTP diphosphatase, partial [Prolixibacteraceae bacterium]|nr:non-canonical purine NTP diphosphatase [Prolixibacteraceae bacterium]
MKLVFATNNKHKLEEIRELLNRNFELLSLADIGCTVEIPEDQDTLEGNASQKSHYIYENYGYSCFADDTGLEVEALNNAPGVHSARYAGPQRNARDNTQKLLSRLHKIKNRNARFRTVISLVIDGKEILFEGVVNGTILEHEKGEQGFGYDPVFQPDGYTLSFAEMDLNEKNKISHRGHAFRKMTDYLGSAEKKVMFWIVDDLS